MKKEQQRINQIGFNRVLMAEVEEIQTKARDYRTEEHKQSLRMQQAGVFAAEELLRGVSWLLDKWDTGDTSKHFCEKNLREIAGLLNDYLILPYNSPFKRPYLNGALEKWQEEYKKVSESYKG